MARNSWMLLAAMVAAVFLAILATTPPGPAPADAPDTAFSATRAMADVREIGREPHPTGSEANAKVRAYLVGRLRQLGLETGEVTGKMDEWGAKRLAGWRGNDDPAPPLVNIVSTLPGRDPSKPAVLLMAHHDSVWGSPGAADDGAGVAAILEAVRAIKAGGQRERDLIVLLTDGEELGLQGAEAFFAQDPRRERVGVIVNLETRGGGGSASMFETGPANGAMIDFWARSVSRPVGTSLSVFIYQHLPNSTDYTVAKSLGIPGFNYAFIGRPGLYHSPKATPEALDQGALQDIGRQALDLTRGLLAAPDLPGTAPDKVFFDAYTLFLISYPVWVGWVIVALGVGGYAVAAWRTVSPGSLARGAGAAVLLFFGAALLLFGFNLASGFDGPVNYYDRLAAIPRLQVQALLVSLGSMALVWALLFGARRSAESTVGAAIPLLLLGIFVQAVAPTAAFPITVPLMLGGLALAIDRFGGGRAGGVAPMIAAALGVGYLLGFGILLLEAVGHDTPMVAALPLVLSAVLVMPLVPAVPRRWLAIVGGVLLALALAIALWVRLDPVAETVASYSSFK